MKTHLITLAAGILLALLLGFYLGNNYVTRLGYQELRNKGFSEAEIIAAIKNGSNLLDAQHLYEDDNAMELALVYKLLLNGRDADAKTKLSEWLRDYLKKAGDDKKPSQARKEVMARLRILGEMDPRILGPMPK